MKEILRKKWICDSRKRRQLEELEMKTIVTERDKENQLQKQQNSITREITKYINCIRTLIVPLYLQERVISKSVF